MVGTTISHYKVLEKMKRAFLIIAIVGVGLLLLLPNNATQNESSSNYASAINSIRAIVVSQITYSDTTGGGSYAPDLATLLNEGLIDSALGSDETGVIRYTTEARPATADDLPLGQRPSPRH